MPLPMMWCRFRGSGGQAHENDRADYEDGEQIRVVPHSAPNGLSPDARVSGDLWLPMYTQSVRIPDHVATHGDDPPASVFSIRRY